MDALQARAQVAREPLCKSGFFFKLCVPNLATLIVIEAQIIF